MNIKKIGLTCLLAMCCTLSVSAHELVWYDGKWAHEGSDLTPDKKVTFGTLKNGVRYAIIPNKLPKGRVSLYLNMQVGSLMEEESEKGFAHFVEHMAFNGTKHFPAGSLIPFFQENGMSFGGDTNAHTSLAETVYKLNLAKVDDASVEKALFILRDFADGMLMEEHEVKDEIGVILSEKKTRESEESLAKDARRTHLYKGTKFEDNVIGTEQSIQSVTSSNLTHFYTTWYRPERAMVVVVGDIEVSKLAPMVEKTFHSFKNDTPPPVVHDFGEVKRPVFELFVQPREMDGVSFSLSIIHPRIFYKDTQERLRESFVQSMASYIFNQRLREIGLKHPHLWGKAQFYNSSKKGLLPSAGLSFISNSEHWEEALKSLIKESKSAQAFGFSVEELSQAKTVIGRNLDKAILNEANQKSSDIANGFVTIANSGAVYTSSQEDKKHYEQFLPTITLAEVNAAFNEAFAPENRTLVVSGKLKASHEQITQAWKSAQKQPFQAYEASVKKEFPYLSLPKEVTSLPKLEKKSLGKDAPTLYVAHYNDTLDIYMIPTKYEHNQVMARLIFGEDKPFGESVLPLRKIASTVLSGSGIGALSPTEVSKLFGGLGLSVSEGFDDANSVINGSATSKDFSPLMQTMWTQYVDPTPKESALIRFKQSLELGEHQKEKSVEGVDQAYSASYFHGDSKRYASMSLESLEQYRLEDIRTFVKNQRDFSRKATMIITGDFEPKSVLKEVVRYFGVHEKKAHKAYDTHLQSASFPSQSYHERIVEDKVDKSVVYRVFESPVENIEDRKRIATINILSAVLKDRLRKELREKSGVAYSPSASFKHSINPVDKGFGLLSMKVTTQTKNKQEALAKMDEIVADLLCSGVSEDEIERLKAPMLTSWKSGLRKSELWHNLLDRELRHELPFVQWHENYPKLLEQIHAKDVNEALAVILNTQKSAAYVITSKGVVNE
ncbi:M16 family metallopeptidase [Sulfurospirillum deleyianum]|uniref:Peptidase M16 domain protein n=1 Tax=Sulfurospirillum deleyianum (strain ATCC 51133 / DSM 6946 / 5175) TaxID=525898 RepID=D1B2C6_SULD5|nr:insulinase family protein [Sulfurospirillum deleyianum]ACZ12246.1 peptidase M16 domain protein [Sulfurospirillum deleyianum DSM 6946]